MIEELKGKNVPIKLWTPADEVEDVALEQLHNIAALPWAFHHVAVMPDVHFGKGATVGSVIAMKDAVSPAAVGVDIGCGMAAWKTSLKASDLPDNLEKLRSNIEEEIPVGFNSREHPAPNSVLFDNFKYLDLDVQDLELRARKQLGTLGGGNHFIELCLDTDQNVWMMLHSGSRNIGKTLAEIHIERAQRLAHNMALPDPDLAVFLANTPEMARYRHDLMWAQEYARSNRFTMLFAFANVLEDMFPHMNTVGPAITCHHNYVSEETHFGEEVLVTRKGAISARLGELGIIPGSMGTRSYIVEGLGNAESFHSASHGAGRRMSRTKARKTFTMQDFESQTHGVCCRKDKEVLDEIPGAYKKIETVMENQKDLVRVVTELKQVLCVKG
jgi:tRNA-splicing ligase RtcB